MRSLTWEASAVPTTAENPATSKVTTVNMMAVPMPRRMPRRSMRLTAGSSANATNIDTSSTTSKVPRSLATPTR